MDFGKHYSAGVSRNTTYKGCHRENQSDLGRLGLSLGGVRRTNTIIEVLNSGASLVEERDSDPNIRRI